MSKYTTEVRFICETLSGLDREESHTVNEYISESREKIFDFSYPLADGVSKEALETKILMHYYFREIGFETVGLWKQRLQSKLMDIMPKYNELYKAQLQIAASNGLNNIDVVTERTFTPGVLRTGETETAGSSGDAYSDTPQGGIEDVKKLKYLSDYRAVDSKSKTTNKDLSVTGQDIDKTTEKGYRGSKTYYEMLKDIQNNILNIDLMIIDELSDLFMLIY